MKFFISALLLSSLPVFAGELSLVEALDASAYELQGEPVTGSQVEAIKKALYNELLPVGTTCSGNFSKNQLLSYFQTNIIDNRDATITLDRSNTEPVLTANSETDSYRFTYAFKTSADLRRAKSVEFTYSTLSAYEKNVGTLLEPKFVNDKLVTLSYVATCAPSIQNIK